MSIPAPLRDALVHLRSPGRRWRNYRKSVRRAEAALARSLTGPDMTADTKAAFDGVLLTRFLMWRRLVFWCVAWIGLPAALIIGIVLTARVRATLVTVDVVATTASLTIGASTHAEWIDTAREPIVYNRLVATGVAIELDDTGSSKLHPRGPGYDLQPKDGSVLRLSALHIPAANTLVMQQSYPGHMQLVVEKTGAAGDVALDVAAPDMVLLADGAPRDSVAQRSPVRQIPLAHIASRSADPQDMLVEFHGLRGFSLSGVVASSVRFADRLEVTDTLRSSIITGTVRLNDTEADSVKLDEGDVLTLQFLEPVRVQLETTPEGIRVRMRGNTEVLQAGPPEQEKEKKLEKMPRRFKVLHDQNPLVWAALLVIIPVIASALFGPRKTV